MIEVKLTPVDDTVPENDEIAQLKRGMFVIQRTVIGVTVPQTVWARRPERCRLPVAGLVPGGHLARWVTWNLRVLTSSYRRENADRRRTASASRHTRRWTTRTPVNRREATSCGSKTPVVTRRLSAQSVSGPERKWRRLSQTRRGSGSHRRGSPRAAPSTP